MHRMSWKHFKKCIWCASIETEQFTIHEATDRQITLTTTASQSYPVNKYSSTVLSFNRTYTWSICHLQPWKINNILYFQEC